MQILVLQFYVFFLLLFTSSCSVLNYISGPSPNPNPSPGPGPNLVPVLHPGPVIFLVTALVPVLVPSQFLPWSWCWFWSKCLVMSHTDTYLMVTASNLDSSHYYNNFLKGKKWPLPSYFIKNICLTL